MVKDFDELEVYKLAEDLTIFVYKLIKDFPKEERYNVIEQTKKASCSIGANVAEGYGRFHYKENIQFCRQARGSLAEVKHFMKLAKELKYISTDLYEEFLKKYDTLKIKLNNYINSIGNKK